MYQSERTITACLLHDTNLPFGGKRPKNRKEMLMLEAVYSPSKF